MILTEITQGRTHLKLPFGWIIYICNFRFSN